MRINNRVQEKEVHTVLAMLPPTSYLRRYVEFASKCTDANMAYHLLGGLVQLSMTAPRNFQFLFGQPIYANLLALCVGESRFARKSSAIRIAERLMRSAFPLRLGDSPGSYEGLVDSISEKPHQLLVFEEFGDFLKKAQEGYMAALKTLINKVADCTPIGRKLAKRSASSAMVEPRVSLIGGITPIYLEKFSDPEDWTGGFFSRFFTIWAERERSWVLPPGDEPSFHALAAELRARSEIAEVGKGIGFDDAALTVWCDWCQALEDLPQHAASETAGAVAGAHMHTLRVAMLLALDYGWARSGKDWQITLQELRPAIAITKLHIKSVLDIGETLAMGRDMQDRRRVYAVVSANMNEPSTLAKLITESKLLACKLQPVLTSLLQEGMILHHPSNGGSYYKNPDRVAQQEDVMQLLARF